MQFVYTLLLGGCRCCAAYTAQKIKRCPFCFVFFNFIFKGTSVLSPVTATIDFQRQFAFVYCSQGSGESCLPVLFLEWNKVSSTISSNWKEGGFGAEMRKIVVKLWKKLGIKDKPKEEIQQLDCLQLSHALVCTQLPDFAQKFPIFLVLPAAVPQTLELWCGKRNLSAFTSARYNIK